MEGLYMLISEKQPEKGCQYCRIMENSVQWWTYSFIGKFYFGNLFLKKKLIRVVMSIEIIS